MASADLRDELDCSICLDTYKDPVTLRCGHNFCRSCIVSALDAQEAAGVYSCPDCRKESLQRPTLKKNRKLANIVERFLSSQPDMESRIFCTYSHNKAVDHSIIEPTVSFEGRKCSTHHEILKYYCPVDGACICVSCWVAGDHKGHDVQLLDVACEKEKEKMRPVIEELKSERAEAGRRVQNLKDHETKQRKTSAALTERVSGLFTDLREKLDGLEKRIQDEITRQQDQMSLSVSDLVRQVELHKDELTKKITQFEGLCNISDPLTFLQEDCGDITGRSCDVIAEVGDVQCLDEDVVSLLLHGGLLHFADSLIDMKIKRKFPVMEKSDILLDIDTADNKIIISEDLRSASYTATSQNRPDGPKRFTSRQVFSSRSFSSGRHYWEVDVSQAERWLIGVAGESMGRKFVGNESYLGYNNKSWALSVNDGFRAYHNNVRQRLVWASPMEAVGIYLDYEVGRLSFYQLCDPIRHLHTFTASFTEPLYAAFYLFADSSIRIMK
ncbi:hypothetical protein GDO78_022204 [Eleutherodactylus coqui]|uniref:Uncharacterized protein n=1 Tax=Eleutherodactylus coqui TaxID=57060 RepID=A0A8J6E510_ELECQ|nr:hypothetical protein GDO78_022204 [Eleutherodactylus coqui]